MSPAPTSCTTWVVIEASGPVLALEKLTVRGMVGDSEIHRGGWSLAPGLTNSTSAQHAEGPGDGAELGLEGVDPGPWLLISPHLLVAPIMSSPPPPACL